MNELNPLFQKSNIVFYTIMMFDFNNQNKGLNGLSGSIKEKMFKHVNMCDLLCLSLNKFGYRHRIFTNSVDQFLCLSNKVDYYDSICHLALTDKIDNSIPYYFAMHKLELSGKINCESEYAFVIDHDCVMIDDLPVNILNVINNRISSVYQITDQVLPAYGLKNIMHDASILNDNSSMGVWYGGEIFGGHANHFKDLNSTYLRLINTFNSSISSLNHCGDENILTNFIQEKMLDGRTFFDLGHAKIFARFWSCPTLHFPVHWNSICDSSLLHLPGDKDFLSSYFIRNNQYFNSDNFLIQYKKYLTNKGYLVDLNFFRPPNKNWLKKIFTFN